MHQNVELHAVDNKLKTDFSNVSNPGLPNSVHVDPHGSIARVHVVNRKMLAYIYIMRAKIKCALNVTS